MKTCSKCRYSYRLDDFYVDRGKRDGLTVWCKRCVKAARRDWYHRNTERAKADARERRTGSRTAHHGACGICGSVETLVQDHDHRCHGLNRSCSLCRRGLLCQACNKALGHMQDDPERLERAAAYLREWAVESGLSERPAADAA